MFKFLNHNNATIYRGQDTVYPVPEQGEKWGPWFKHPDPYEYDGKACGPGGWHLMKRLDAFHAPTGWWPWWAEGRGWSEKITKRRGIERSACVALSPKCSGK